MKKSFYIGLITFFTIIINAEEYQMNNLILRNVNISEFSTVEQELFTSESFKVMKLKDMNKLIKCLESDEKRKLRDFTKKDIKYSSFDNMIDGICEKEKYNEITNNLKPSVISSLFQIKNNIQKEYNKKYEDAFYYSLYQSISNKVNGKDGSLEWRVRNIKSDIPIIDSFKGVGLSKIFRERNYTNYLDRYSLTLTLFNCKRDTSNNSIITCNLKIENLFKNPHKLMIGQPKLPSVIDQFGQEQNILEFQIGNKISETEVTHMLYPKLPINGSIKIFLKGNTNTNIIHLLKIKLDLLNVKSDDELIKHKISEYEAFNILIK